MTQSTKKTGKPMSAKAGKKDTAGKGQQLAWIKFVESKELGPWNDSTVGLANLKWGFYAGYKAGSRRFLKLTNPHAKRRDGK